MHRAMQGNNMHPTCLLELLLLLSCTCLAINSKLLGFSLGHTENCLVLRRY